MTRIAGVTTLVDQKGDPASITIDLKEHPEAVSLLKNAGLMEKTAFDIEFESPENLTLEQLRDHLIAHINTLPWKEKSL